MRVKPKLVTSTFVSTLAVLACAACQAEIRCWDNGDVLVDVDPAPAVQLSGQSLEFAALGNVDLSDGNFSRSNLSHASFRDSTLTNANLDSTILFNADLTGAFISGASFVDVTVNGLTPRTTLLNRQLQSAES